ncbi:MAG TPA: hypothetical protein PLK31_21330 [Chloroflexota bacterium]|nr:hypothetical protein [Chloroflexota bacterium]
MTQSWLHLKTKEGVWLFVWLFWLVACRADVSLTAVPTLMPTAVSQTTISPPTPTLAPSLPTPTSLPTLPPTYTATSSPPPTVTPASSSPSPPPPPTATPSKVIPAAN